jgi:hypothetical protein
LRGAIRRDDSLAALDANGRRQLTVDEPGTALEGPGSSPCLGGADDAPIGGLPPGLPMNRRLLGVYGFSASPEAIPATADGPGFVGCCRRRPVDVPSRKRSAHAGRRRSEQQRDAGVLGALPTAVFAAWIEAAWRERLPPVERPFGRRAGPEWATRLTAVTWPSARAHDEVIAYQGRAIDARFCVNSTPLPDLQTCPPAVRLFRLAKILSIASRYGLDEMILEHEPSGRLAALSRCPAFLATLRHTAGGSPAPGTGVAGADLRQVWPGSVDASRPAAYRHRR